MPLVVALTTSLAANNGILVRDRAAADPSIWAKLRYRFDLALSRGPLVVIGYLGLVMLAFNVLGADEEARR